MKNILLLIIFIFSARAYSNEQAIFEKRLEEMVNQGLISPEEAKSEAVKYKYLGNQQDSLKEQARGISSTMKKTKVLLFQNEPIEIQVAN